MSAAYTGPDTEARIAALREVAQELNATANQVVLAWMMHRQPPLLPAFSGGRPEHMQENLGALDLTLSTDQMAKFNNAGHCVNEEPN
ncbi:aldo/keto reductase [Leptolyngbya ectocarpi]|uniref:aldo/keto reductase n=1 Tax=Leptolyngbya ectocarpi TaxID=1202 RepID=UPI0038992C9F